MGHGEIKKKRKEEESGKEKEKADLYWISTLPSDAFQDSSVGITPPAKTLN